MSCTARSTPAKDQSYVLGVLTADQLAHAMFPLGDSTKAAGAGRGGARAGSRSPHKPDSHDICFIPDGDTPGFLRGRLGGRTGADRRRRRRRCSASTTARTPSRSASARVCGSACRPPDGEPRYVLDIAPGRAAR